MLLLWIINALTLLLVANYLPGFHVSGFYAALITALVLGLVNAVIRPIVILFTLPINLLTLGLFTFVINGLMIWLVSTVVKGFEVDSFNTALWAALILWLISFVTNALTKKA
ncbi:MAG TPA: phage holin family protein [Patescibacteria group bacterium]